MQKEKEVEKMVHMVAERLISSVGNKVEEKAHRWAAVLKRAIGNAVLRCEGDGDGNGAGGNTIGDILREMQYADARKKVDGMIGKLIEKAHNATLETDDDTG